MLPHLFTFVTAAIASLLVVPLATLPSPMDFRVSLSGVYVATLLGASMMALDALRFPIGVAETCLIGLLFLVGLVGYRFQLGVTDSQFVADMIPRRSAEILVTEAVYARSKNPALLTMAERMLTVDKINVKTLKNMATK